MRLTWLPEVLRAGGVPNVIVMPGYRERGRELATIRGVVAHHTATPATWHDEDVVRLLINGRPDLSGPLAQCGLARNGWWYVVAAGRANHNGYGRWGNESIGVEAFNDGVGEPWPSVQLDSYQRGCAAICKFLKLDAAHVEAHREQDPKRKIDPKGIDMPSFRARVAALQQEEVDDMPSIEELRKLQEEDHALRKQLHEDFTERIAVTNGILREIRERLPKSSDA